MYFSVDGWLIDDDEVYPKKPNHKAPKSIRGEYDLSIHGNKIVLVDNVDGTTVEAKCHPDDDFDIGTGIEEAFKRMNHKREEIRRVKEEEEKKIKVRDWVKIVDNGATCAQTVNFFKDNNLLSCAARFRYGVIPFNGTKGKVIFIERQDDWQESIIAVEVSKEKYCGSREFSDLNCYDGIYLIKAYGLRKEAKPYV